MELKSVQGMDGIGPEAAVVMTYFSDQQMEEVQTTWLDSAGLAGYKEGTARGELRGRLYRSTVFRGQPTVVLVGLGKKADFAFPRYRRAVEAGVRSLTEAGFHDIAILVPSYASEDGGASGAVRAAIAASYSPDFLKSSGQEARRIDRLTIVDGGVNEHELAMAETVAESTNVARHLLNLPPCDLNPSAFADRVVSISEEAGFEVDVLDESGIRELGMGAILGVSAGSSQPPRVIDMKYGDEAADVKLTFVGKGLTYDSGGLSLKTHEGLEWMKGDMGGAAAVVGALRAIAILKPAGIFVRGIVGAAENMPGPAAMKPGDVLHPMNGKTIEVLNTDAEGRLVLSDVLSYAVSLGATHIVDLATLTGAAVVALGNEACAVVGRPQSWVDKVLDAGRQAAERMWQMPLFPEYRALINSDIADMKNTGGRAGGVLTASALLSEFVDDVPWAHLDIAGTAWLEKTTVYAASGGTGYGVASLVQLALNMAARG